ncbi:MAG: tRNA (5-methylaminomethyl-2-thiouridine)(34)-methyltransferase MnmD [Bacteroidales bacterium]
MDNHKPEDNLRLVLTEDGSHTLLKNDWGEPYHSLHGALQESEHVFIRSGLEYCKPKQGIIRLLEIGMGTGLNALLAWQLAEKKRISIEYWGIEPFPLSHELAGQLNYPQILKAEGGSTVFQNIHAALLSGEEKRIGEYFHIKVFHQDFRKVELPSQAFDCVFFDAFDPAKVPDLWTTEAFRQLYTSLMPAGILVTYSAKGLVRRNLKAAGFWVEKLPGPPGKREITRAIKQPS